MTRYITVPFRPEMRDKDVESDRAAKIVSEQMEEQITRMASRAGCRFVDGVAW